MYHCTELRTYNWCTFPHANHAAIEIARGQSLKRSKETEFLQIGDLPHTRTLPVRRPSGHPWLPADTLQVKSAQGKVGSPPPLAPGISFLQNDLGHMPTPESTLRWRQAQEDARLARLGPPAHPGARGLGQKLPDDLDSSGGSVGPPRTNEVRPARRADRCWQGMCSK